MAFKIHNGTCSCGCGKNGLIVVSKGYIHECNERIKKAKKAASPRIKPIERIDDSADRAKITHILKGLPNTNTADKVSFDVSKSFKGRKKSKSKKKPVSLDKQLDSIFSEYIRLKYSDENGFVNCFTCDDNDYWRDMHNGHYKKRRHNGTRYEEKNCHPQCWGCNIEKDGNDAVYEVRLMKAYGHSVLEFLDNKKNEETHISDAQYQELIDHYEAEVEKLKASKTLKEDENNTSHFLAGKEESFEEGSEFHD